MPLDRNGGLENNKDNSINGHESSFVVKDEPLEWKVICDTNQKKSIKFLGVNYIKCNTFMFLNIRGEGVSYRDPEIKVYLYVITYLLKSVITSDAFHDYEIS